MKLLADERLIVRLQFLGSIGLVIAVVAALGGYFILQQRREYAETANDIMAQQIQMQEAVLTERVHATRDYLDYMRSRTESVLKTKIREEVDQAVTLAATIYSREIGRLPKDEVEALIIDAIRPLRFYDGRGYFFIYRLDGLCKLLPTDPDREGRNMLDMRDDTGTAPVPLILSAAKSPAGAGYLDYRWKILGQGELWSGKIGYARLFEPLGWAIGTGEYPQAVEQDLKEVALSRLRGSNTGEWAYVAALDDTGTLLVAPFDPAWEGRALADLPADRVRTLKDLVALGQDGGGFLRYDWPVPGERRIRGKLSYVERMDDWGWTLVSGVYLEEVEAAATARQRALEDSVGTKIRLSLVVLGLGVAGAILIRGGLQFLLDNVIARYERNLAERNQALKEAGHQLFLVNFMVEHSAEMIMLLDARGRLVYANRAVTERLGWRRDQVATGPFAALVGAGGDGDADGYRRVETEVQAQDGHPIPVEIGVKTLVHDKTRYLFAIARDVTERRRHETELKRSNAELEAFAYVVSHDLRQPVRAVIGFLGLLEQALAPALAGEAREYFDFARDGARRMDRMILDLLDYSRVGRGGRGKAAIDVAGVIAGLAPMLALAFKDAGGRFEIEGSLPTVWGDCEELTRLFQNLIDNAVKYRSPERPLKVTLSCRAEGEDWLFCLADNGMGIPERGVERIFRLFLRMRAGDGAEGTGIGLALCRKIVEAHGGRIWAESEPGAGARFLFTLPSAAISRTGETEAVALSGQ